jgi:hypothetical protein
MTLSGMDATIRAFLYSGFFSKSEEFSSVETSSVHRHVSVRDDNESRTMSAHLCKPARILALARGSTFCG